jgi:hypothetical protein
LIVSKILKSIVYNICFLHITNAKTMKNFLLLSLLIGIYAVSEAQNTITLSPSKDNTIYSESGSTSNGSGQHLFVGRTNSGNLRRTLIAFDIAGALQPGDSIISATLKLRVNKTRNTTPRSILMHRLTVDWGEGASDAGGEEGGGTSAATNDATWTQTFFGITTLIPWATPGGDYDQIPTEDFSLSNTGPYEITGSQLTQDVRDWFNNPATNFGWILIGDEANNASAKRIGSSENGSNPIALEIEYSSPVSLSEDLTLENLSITPNPVDATFTLRGVESLETLQIINLNGKKVKEFNSLLDSYDVSDLQRGIYFLKVSDGKKKVPNY